MGKFGVNARDGTRAQLACEHAPARSGRRLRAGRPPLRILALCGSARRDSVNAKLLAVAVAALRVAGPEVTVVDHKAWRLPLYRGDWEQADGLPAAATQLAELGASHHALLIASPEYNGFITPLPKNILDGMSRTETDPFAGKVAAVVSALPGALGGIKSQIFAKQFLSNLGCFVIPATCTLPRSRKAFAPDGALKDARAAKSVEALVAESVEATRKLTVTG